MNLVCIYSSLFVQGYYGDGFNCQSYVSCIQDPDICSEDATCVITGDQQYACLCNEGFVGDGMTCKSRPRHPANFLLVNQGMATHRIPFFSSNSNSGAPINIAYSQMAIALDIDCLNGKAYSSDITGKEIIYYSQTSILYLIFNIYYLFHLSNTNIIIHLSRRGSYGFSLR